MNKSFDNMVKMQESVSTVTTGLRNRISSDAVSVGKAIEAAMEVRRSATAAMQDGDSLYGMKMFRDYGFMSSDIALLYSKLDNKAQAQIGALEGEFWLDSAYGFMMAGDYTRGFDAVGKAQEAFSEDAIRNGEEKSGMSDPKYVASECNVLEARCDVLKEELRDAKKAIEVDAQMAHSDIEYRKLVGDAFEKVLRV